LAGLLACPLPCPPQSQLGLCCSVCVLAGVAWLSVSAALVSSPSQPTIAVCRCRCRSSRASERLVTFLNLSPCLYVTCRHLSLDGVAGARCCDVPACPAATSLYVRCC
jgi:hypothetical protein